MVTSPPGQPESVRFASVTTSEVGMGRAGRVAAITASLASGLTVGSEITRAEHGSDAVYQTRP